MSLDCALRDKQHYLHELENPEHAATLNIQRTAKFISKKYIKKQL